MIKVLLICENFFINQFSGIPIFYRLLKDELEVLGCEVSIFASELPNIRDCDNQIFTRKDLSRVFDYDFDLAFAPNASLEGEIFSNLRLARVQVLTLHTDHLVDPGRSRMKAFLLRRKYKLMYRLEGIDYFFANSETTARHICSFIPDYKAQKVVMSPHPVGLKSVRSEASTVNRNSFHKPYFLVLGTRSARKRALKLARLWVKGTKKNPSSAPFLYFIGPKGHQDKWIRLNTWFFKAENIVLCGVVSDEDKIAIMRNAEAVIVPSRYESYSLVINEALSQKKPVIAFSDVRWTQEHILKDYLYLCEPKKLFDQITENLEQNWMAVNAKLKLIDLHFSQAVALFIENSSAK